MVKAIKQRRAIAWPAACAVALVGATAVLLVIGAVVNPMGASLACPDWVFLPTCDGLVFPPMIGGVLFEHGHRLWATLVGVLTIVVALGTWLQKKPTLSSTAQGGGLGDERLRQQTRVLAIVAVGLVVLQGTLGGVTVLLGLHPLVSTVHLVVAFAFLCLTLELALRLGGGGNLGALPAAPHRFVRATLGVVFLQIALGGAVRHMGGGMACGMDWLGCGPTWWPSHGLGHLHMTHRLVGYLLAVKVLLLCVQVHRHAQGVSQRVWAWLPALLVAVQVALGWLSVASLRSVLWVVLHTCGAILLVGVLFLLEASGRKPI